jgi:NAD(P)-dependent dehydrogenase (short-subunit alcohol dehydrogenase family)
MRPTYHYLHAHTKTGIGLELTKQAHSIGAKVLVADLKITSDFDTFARGKENILYVQSDVTKWSDFTKLFDACEKKWNDVPDAYGICAGLFDPPFSNFWQDPEQDEGYKQVDVNVNHPIKLTRMALRKSLQKRKRASICIIVRPSLNRNMKLALRFSRRLLVGCQVISQRHSTVLQSTQWSVSSNP